MKTLMIIILATFSFVMPQGNPKLIGKYRTEFDKKYLQQTYELIFKDSTYVKKMPDAVTYKGKITYEKYKTTFRQNKDDDPIEIDSKEINKDTIKFTIRNKTDLSLTKARGRLIRIK